MPQRLFTMILLLLVGSVSFAQDFEYESLEMVQPDQGAVQSLNLTFKDLDFYPVTNSVNGIPSLALNQIYFKDENEFVTVKFGLRGNFPLNKIIKTPKGFLVHRMIGKQTVAFYFRGISLTSVEKILTDIQKIASAHHRGSKFSFIASASAADCDATQGVANQPNVNSMSGAIAWNMLKQCMGGMGDGIWSATGGMVVSAGNEAWKFLKHPIDYAENVADIAGKFLTGTANFVKTLITNPSKAFASVGKGIGSSWDKLALMVSSMSAEMKVNFVCSLIGSIGIDAAIAFFTGGAASAKVVATITRIVETFSKIKRLISVLAKSKFLKIEKFMKKAMNNLIPDGDLLALESMVKNSDGLSLGALTCYLK